MSTRELAAALRAEIWDMLDHLKNARGNMFSIDGRAALRCIDRIGELLEMLEKAA